MNNKWEESLSERDSRVRGNNQSLEKEEKSRTSFLFLFSLSNETRVSMCVFSSPSPPETTWATPSNFCELWRAPVILPGREIRESGNEHGTLLSVRVLVAIGFLLFRSIWLADFIFSIAFTFTFFLLLLLRLLMLLSRLHCYSTHYDNKQDSGRLSILDYGAREISSSQLSLSLAHTVNWYCVPCVAMPNREAMKWTKLSYRNPATRLSELVSSDIIRA